MGISRVALIAALCAAALAAPLSPAVADQKTSAAPSQPTRDVNITGPGLYIPQTRTFELPERAEFTGVFDRVYRITSQKNGRFEATSPAAERADLSVFGAGWQADILGGMTSRRLDLSGGQAQATDLAEGESIRYAVQGQAKAGEQTYAAAGSTLTVTTTKDADGQARTQATETIAQGTATGVTAGSTIKAADLDLVLTWEQVAGDWRVTSVATAAYGASTVTYDDKGRAAVVTDLDTTLTLTYAGTTTATAGKPGDFAGLLASAESKSKQSAVHKRAAYAYDENGLLRSATLDDGRSTATTTYSYDQAGRLARLASPAAGTWDIAFPASGARPKATLDEAASSDGPGIGLLNVPSTCPNASQWMWHTQSECRVSPVAHYGWKASSAKTTPTGHTVIGITYDHCSSPTGDAPGGYNFAVACDMHDYGFGVIGNYYKLPATTYYMTPDKKSAVDEVFYTTLTDRTCPAYGSPFGCEAWAWTYRQGVRLGDPQNGADAT
ncbi:phospholipase A2 [Nonomuraea sp. NPDC004297]